MVHKLPHPSCDGDCTPLLSRMVEEAAELSLPAGDGRPPCRSCAHPCTVCTVPHLGRDGLRVRR